MTNLGDLSSNAQIPTAGIADDAVTAAKIAADAVGTSEIAADAVTSSEIATDAVGTAEIAANAVTASEIATGAVGSDEIATDAVGTTEIAADAVTASEIAAGAVGSSEIATDAVGTDEIAANAVTASEIATGAVGSDEIATDAVTAAEIAANAVGTAEIADDAVTSPKLNLTSAWLPPSAVTPVISGDTEVIDGSTSAAMVAGTYLLIASYTISADSADSGGLLALNYGLATAAELPIRFDLTAGQSEQRIVTISALYTVAAPGATFYAALMCDLLYLQVEEAGGLSIVRIG